MAVQGLFISNGLGKSNVAFFLFQRLWLVELGDVFYLIHIPNVFFLADVADVSAVIVHTVDVPM